MESCAAAAGATAEIPEKLRIVLSNMRASLRDFAVESWLDRFPGFVSDLEGRLRTYASALRQAEQNVAADADGTNPDPRAPLWGLLAVLRSSQSSGQVSPDDFEWFRARALLAIDELASGPAPMPDEPVPSPVPSLTSLAPAASPSPVPSTSSSAARPSALRGSRPKPRLVTPDSVSSSSASPALSGVPGTLPRIEFSSKVSKSVDPAVAAAEVCIVFVPFRLFM